MKRYTVKNVLLPVLLALTVEYSHHQQSTVYRERPGRDDKPTDSHPNGWQHGDLGAGIQAGGIGLTSLPQAEQSVTFNQINSPIHITEYICKTNTFFLPFSTKRMRKKHDKSGERMRQIFIYPQPSTAHTTKDTDNIFKNEEGMPTPPRVESLARTTTLEQKVKFRIILHTLHLLTRKRHDLFSPPGRRQQTATRDKTRMKSGVNQIAHDSTSKPPTAAKKKQHTEEIQLHAAPEAADQVTAIQFSNRQFKNKNV